MIVVKFFKVGDAVPFMCAAAGKKDEKNNGINKSTVFGDIFIFGDRICKFRRHKALAV